MPAPPVVLCIDDNVTGLSIRKLLLEAKGFHVLVANDGPSGLAIVGRERVDAVILDYKMPGMSGEETARRLRTEFPQVPILLLSGFAEEIPESLLAMVDAFVAKGTHPEILLKELERITGASAKPMVDVPSTEEARRRAVERANELLRHSAELERKYYK